MNKTDESERERERKMAILCFLRNSGDNKIFKTGERRERGFVQKFTNTSLRHIRRTGRIVDPSKLAPSLQRLVIDFLERHSTRTTTKQRH